MENSENKDFVTTYEDRFGIWEVQRDGAMKLITPSESWLAEQEELNRITNETPSQEDLDKANRQIEIINTLMEVGLL